jgi:hypothetical protein
MIELTNAHRNDLSQMRDQVAIVQFLTIRDETEFEGYMAASATAVSRLGGHRRHQCRIDQVLAGGSMPYDAILVDLFPAGDSALKAFDASAEGRAAAATNAYILAVKPATSIALNMVRRLGFLAPIVSRLVGTTFESPLPETGNWNPNTMPVPETIALFRQDDQSSPFYMMNLNKYYAKARYADSSGEDTGEEAYARYGNRIAPYLISVGGYPDLMGHVIGVLAGDEASPMHDDWSEFAMVYYPSRRVFLRMMTNSPTRGINHREAGLERAVLMPSSNW